MQKQFYAERGFDETLLDHFMKMDYEMLCEKYELAEELNEDCKIFIPQELVEAYNTRNEWYESNKCDLCGADTQTTTYQFEDGNETETHCTRGCF